MAVANGICRVFDALNARNWHFQARDSVSGGIIDSKTGDWNLVGTGAGAIVEWTGSNPTMEAPSDTTVNRLLIAWANGFGPDEVVCGINHSDVVLSPGDTIVYTSINMNFNTTDPV